MARTAAAKLQVTKNYRFFHRSDENRPLDMSKHKKLKKSMQKYGFLPSFPLSTLRNGKGLIVNDGQHRLALAEELGLPIYYVIENEAFDIAEVNETQQTWKLTDYIQKFATNGVKSYQELLEFVELHKLPIAISAGLLAGTVSWTNVRDAFFAGRFAIKDRQYADDVASVYTKLTTLSKDIKNARCLEACMALCRVEGFDANRLISGAKKSRDKLASYSTRDAYLTMLEEVYNFNRQKRVPLKFQADEAMKKRSVVK